VRESTTKARKDAGRDHRAYRGSLAPKVRDSAAHTTKYFGQVCQDGICCGSPTADVAPVCSESVCGEFRLEGVWWLPIQIVK
jgi:hypothetical protein